MQGSITIPDSITEIYEETFFRCDSLTSVTLPAGITSIGGYAFIACDSLKTVYFKGTDLQWNNIAVDWGNEVIDSVKVVTGYTGAGAGDVNLDGEVNNKDIVALFRYVSGGEKAEDEAVYDFNADGEVNNKDVTSLFRYVSSI